MSRTAKWEHPSDSYRTYQRFADKGNRRTVKVITHMMATDPNAYDGDTVATYSPKNLY